MKICVLECRSHCCTLSRMISRVLHSVSQFPLARGRADPFLGGCRIVWPNEVECPQGSLTISRN